MVICSFRPRICSWSSQGELLPRQRRFIEPVGNDPSDGRVIAGSEMSSSATNGNQSFSSCFFSQRKNTYTTAVSLLAIGLGSKAVQNILFDLLANVLSSMDELLSTPFTDKLVDGGEVFFDGAISKMAEVALMESNPIVIDTHRLLGVFHLYLTADIAIRYAVVVLLF